MRHKIEFERPETRQEVSYLAELQDLVHFQLESYYDHNQIKKFSLKFHLKEGIEIPRTLCIHEKQGKDIRDFLLSQHCALTFYKMPEVHWNQLLPLSTAAGRNPSQDLVAFLEEMQTRKPGSFPTLTKAWQQAKNQDPLA